MRSRTPTQKGRPGSTRSGSASSSARTSSSAVGIAASAGISLKGEQFLRELAAQTGGRAYFPARETELGDGGLEVELPAGRLEWLDRLLLRLWPYAEVVEPPELRDRVRELAARTGDRYRDAEP